MLIHNSPLLNIFFGDARYKFRTKDFSKIQNGKAILDKKPFDRLKKNWKIKTLDFLKQIHGSDGVFISSPEQAINIKPFSITGDYIITNIPKIGIGVVTADCLPIVIQDKFNGVIAIVHASWKNSIQKISIKVVKKMQELFNTKLENLVIYFGPSAKPCCYEVEKGFEKNLYNFANEVIHYRDDNKKIFFDLPLFNILQLESIGVSKQSFRLQYNDCTICDEVYCSYRRDKDDYRQITAVSLK